MSVDPSGVPALPREADALAELYAMASDRLCATMVMSLDGAGALPRITHRMMALGLD